jgi:hypothetical protein
MNRHRPRRYDPLPPRMPRGHLVARAHYSMLGRVESRRLRSVMLVDRSSGEPVALIRRKPGRPVARVFSIAARLIRRPGLIGRMRGVIDLRDHDARNLHLWTMPIFRMGEVQVPE